jgi:uncharacterized repeat protein (TIGR03803 family)
VNNIGPKLGIQTAAVIALAVALGGTAVPAHAQQFATLFSFDFTDGSQPWAGLVQGADGDFYGTTYNGGPSSAMSMGTVFKITSSGTLTTLHNFIFKDHFYPDGDNAFGQLVQGTNGDFYGTTYQGGDVGGVSGGGTVFRITPTGKFTLLHTFDGTDGSLSYAGLIQATNGDFLGTTTAGGTYDSGTIFKITPTGTLTTLHNFGSAGDGTFPYSALIQGTDGNFYGTTSEGGTNNYGTVFKMTPNGNLTVLHSFDGSDGDTPYAGLIQSGSDFFGTTSGNATNNFGTVFQITPGGALTTLHYFGSAGDGTGPWCALVKGSDGNFYGTTRSGGANSDGTVFRITTGGKLTILHSFDQTDGADPVAGLIQSDGVFYGTTYAGGAGGVGTIFTLSVAGGPF